MAVPIGVRATCYYYRKLYYRSFWLSPPACAVSEPHARYSGESRFPLVLQNVHRYFWAFSVLVAVMLTVDAVNAFRQPGGIGIGVGTFLISLNGAAFWAYILSCHGVATWWAVACDPSTVTQSAIASGGLRHISTPVMDSSP